MIQQQDTLAATGLDTLSERALRRLTERWTGELHLPDSLGVESIEQVATPQTFEHIVAGWQRARDTYHDAPLEQVMGGGAEFARSAMPLSDLSDSAPVLEGVDSYISEVMLSPSGWWQPWLWVDELYNLLVAVMFLYYLICICRYWDDIRALFESVFNRKVRTSGRAGERRRSDIFYGSLGKLFMLGACFVGVLTAMGTTRAGYAMTHGEMFYLPFGVLAAFVVVVFVQYIVLGLIGLVTRSLSDIASFMRIRLTYFVLATVLASPIMLMALIGTQQAADVWLRVGCVAIVITLILFIRESIEFFISKKVSILHWFLYLCTVEILPLTLIWQAVVRLR